MIILNIFSNPYIRIYLESVKKYITSINYGSYRHIVVISLGKYKIYPNSLGQDINDPLTRSG